MLKKHFFFYAFGFVSCYFSCYFYNSKEEKSVFNNTIDVRKNTGSSFLQTTTHGNSLGVFVSKTFYESGKLKSETVKNIYNTNSKKSNILTKSLYDEKKTTLYKEKQSPPSLFLFSVTYKFDKFNYIHPYSKEKFDFLFSYRVLNPLFITVGTNPGFDKLSVGVTIPF